MILPERGFNSSATRGQRPDPPDAAYTVKQFTYQISDHFPIWIQIKTDIDGQRLDQIVQDSKKE